MVWRHEGLIDKMFYNEISLNIDTSICLLSSFLKSNKDKNGVVWLKTLLVFLIQTERNPSHTHFKPVTSC